MATYNTYTSANGQTIPGSQVDQGWQQMAGMSTGQLANAATQQQTANNNFDTPAVRTQGIQNSDIPAEQANYDALAKQLYQYDQMNLAPKYGGAPTAQPGAASFGRVDASTLSQLTPEAVQSGTVGLSNSNPSYGINAQTTQAGLLTNLIGSLNDAITQEFTSKKGQYVSSANKGKETLQTLLTFLDRAQTREENAKDRAAQAAERAAASGKQANNDYYSAVSDGVDRLAKGEDWGTVWNRIKSRFPDKVNNQIDTDLGTQWKKPGAYENYLKKGLDVKQNYKASATSDVDFSNMAKGLDSYLERRKGTNFVERINPASSKGIAINTEKDVLSRTLAKLVEKNRISDSDAKFYMSQLPAIWMSDDEAASKIEGIKNGLSAKLGLDYNNATKNSSSGAGEWQ